MPKYVAPSIQVIMLATPKILAGSLIDGEEHLTDDYYETDENL